MANHNSKDNYLKLSDICTNIQNTLKANFGKEKYWIQAEISDLKITNGHCYISLIEKDNKAANPKASIRGMIWSSHYIILNNRFNTVTGFDLKRNIKILFQATVNYHILFGLNLTLVDIEPAFTVGSMQIEREETVKKLKEEGHYYLNKKLEFPIVPQRIAVISAKDSKGYEDFINKIEKNQYNYKYSIILFTSLLQGDNAAKDITGNLIKIFKEIKSFDIAVIIRGGGGEVNLNCFNDYLLAKAVARFPIPVITGIGHTTNISIVDEVAFLDKITPTDVADFIIEKTREFEENVEDNFGKIISRYKEVKNNDINENKLKIQKLFHSFDKIKTRNINYLSNSFSVIVNLSKQLVKDRKKDIYVYLQSLNRISVNSVKVNLNTILNLADKIKQLSKFKISYEKKLLINIIENMESNIKGLIKKEELFFPLENCPLFRLKTAHPI